LAVDSSALIAIAKGEPEAPALLEALLNSGSRIGWPTIFETRIWLLRRGHGEATRWFSAWLARPTTTIVPFDAELESLAFVAFERFGKGRHPAALNFGDCMTYAVARRDDLPLLFRGGDFGQTDLNIHGASVIVA
jgi:ribonuclease VapC